jgi:hypothetical protein
MRYVTLNLAMAVTIASIFVMVLLLAQAGSLKADAVRAPIEKVYILAADPYLPIQMVDPVY